MIKLDKCPFCGGEAIFNITGEITKHFEIGFDFKIICTRCNITFPIKGEVSLTLEENGTLRYKKDNRLELASKWNTRTFEEVQNNESDNNNSDNMRNTCDDLMD